MKRELFWIDQPRTVKDVVNNLLFLEGGKKGIDQGQMREIARILSDLLASEEDHDLGYSTFDILAANGRRRARRKKK